MTYESMGKLIQTRRKELGLTQKDLAEKLNITDKAVSKWERDIACPDTATIPKLAEILGVRTDELLIAKMTEKEEQQIAPQALDEETYYEDLAVKEYHFNELLKTLIFSGVSFLAAFGLFGLLLREVNPSDKYAFLMGLFPALYFFGLPSGWSITKKLFGGWTVIGPLWIAVFFVRISITLVIGIVALPVNIIIHFIKCYSSSKSVRAGYANLNRRIVKLFIIFFVCFLTTVASFIGFFFLESWEKEKTAASQIQEDPVTAEAFKGTILFDELCQDALQNTQAQENEVVNDYGWEVSQSTEIQGVYFLKAKTTECPHHTILQNVYLSNAVVVIAGYYVEKGSDVAIDSWEYDIWIYPNFFFDKNGTLTYEMDEVYEHSVREENVKAVLEWLSNEYADMSITEMEYS